MKRTTAEVERGRLLRARAPEFFAGLAHRLWVGRLVFAPQFASMPQHYPSGQSRYLLDRDETAREWVTEWLSEWIAGIEDALKQSPFRPSVSKKRKEVIPKSKRNIEQLVARSRREGLRQTLQVAGFTTWRQLLPDLEAILTAQRRSLPPGHELIVRQLPKVLTQIERQLRKSARMADGQAPPVGTVSSVTSEARSSREERLLQRMPVVREEAERFLRAHRLRQRPRGRPWGRGGLRGSAERSMPIEAVLVPPDPVDLRPYRSRILKLRNVLSASSTSPIHARLGWLLEITGIWQFHALEPMPLFLNGQAVDRTPATARPFPHLSQFIPCSFCKTSRQVVSCPRR